MKRKDFIKTTATFATGASLVPISACKSEKKEMKQAIAPKRRNWAGNYTYQAEQLHRPETTADVQKLVQSLKAQKALGSRHCFNNIADSPKNQISTENLKGILSLDEEAMTVTVGAGSKYGDFATELHRQGYALHNLASLPHISVAGACATATHGSGVSNGNLATGVVGLKFVSGAGEIVTLQKGGEDDAFHGAVVNLGALGIITEMTLDVQKTFDVRQDIFQELPLQSLIDNFDAILSAGYSVSLFTDWQNDLISQVWIKRRLDEEVSELGDTFYGARAATRDLHPITDLSAENCTAQMGVPGPWFDRLPHFKMGFTPSSGEELQSEFFVPYENALDAILALEAKGDAIGPQLLITEIRTIAADDFWMSPCYQAPCVAIHFTWKQNPQEVGGLIAMIESELQAFQARPHWGKLFSIDSATLKTRYERWSDFMALVQQYDPERKFANAYLEQHIYNA